MDTFYTKKYVDAQYVANATINHEGVANSFLLELQKLNKDEFEHLLIISGFIPDTYEADSSQETLFTKLNEALIAEWSRRIGCKGDLIKQKASYEDIKIEIDGKTVVCDAKSYRLGRSQAAPNVKDFLKLEDIRKWMDRYKNALGGLVVYPCKHDFKDKSDAYQYGSTKDVPTVILPFKILAFLLHYFNDATKSFNASILKLWDYKNIFPNKLDKNVEGGNKKAYWSAMEKVLLEITGASAEDYAEYIRQADEKIDKAVDEVITYLEMIVKKTSDEIDSEVRQIADESELRYRLTSCLVEQRTAQLRTTIARIREFRKGESK